MVEEEIKPVTTLLVCTTNSVHKYDKSLAIHENSEAAELF